MIRFTVHDGSHTDTAVVFDNIFNEVAAVCHSKGIADIAAEALNKYAEKELEEQR